MSVPFFREGRVTRDPELKFMSSGQGVANFAIAENDRYKDANGEWKDGDTSFWNCQAFGQLAENICESFVQGQLVVVIGKMKQRSYENKDGEKRTVYEVTVDACGPSLKWDAFPANARESRQEKQKPAADPWAQESPPF